MNNFMWLFIVLCLGGGGYYEYTALQTKAAADRQVIKMEFQTKIDQLETDKKALAEANEKLTKSQEESQSEMAALVAKVDAAQKALAVAKNPAVATQASVGGTPGAVASSTSNSLGTIATTDGKSFPDSELLKVDVNGITIKYATGITKVEFLVLPPEMQKRFGFDLKNGVSLTPEQAELAETQRKAAGGR